MASALVTDDTPLSRASALGLFILTVAVTPANTYMWSHNALAGAPENADESMLSMEKGAPQARRAGAAAERHVGDGAPAVSGDAWNPRGRRARARASVKQ